MDPVKDSPDLVTADTKEKKKAGKKQMGFEKIRASLERLQLAWMRFAITLSAFGFTIAKLLEAKLQEGRQPVLGFITGREIGLFMLVMGITGLILATRHYMRVSSKLKKLYEEMPWSISLFMAFIILAFCVFLLLVVLFRL